MPANTINQNLIPNEPQLVDLLELHKKGIFLNLNCHHVGTIQSFNASNQTASASINYKKTYFEFDNLNNVYTPSLVNYPILAECPVIFLGGESTALTFPIAQGDECLILFNDRDIDNWFTGGSGSPNATARLHSFSDGIILVGLRSLNHSLTNVDTTRSMLRAGSTTNSITAVGVNPSNSKILLTNKYPANSVTLNSLLQDLISNIKDLVTAVNAITVTTNVTVPSTPFGPSPFTSGTPNNSTQINNITTELTTTSNEILGMLE